MLCACPHVSDMSVWLPSLTGSLTCNSVPLAGNLAVSDVFGNAVHMFGMPTWLLGSTLLHPPVSTGKFHVFMVYSCVLMGSVMSAVISVPLQMSGTSLCSLEGFPEGV